MDASHVTGLFLDPCLARCGKIRWSRTIHASLRALVLCDVAAFRDPQAFLDSGGLDAQLLILSICTAVCVFAIMCFPYSGRSLRPLGLVGACGSLIILLLLLLNWGWLARVQRWAMGALTYAAGPSIFWLMLLQSPNDGRDGP